MKTDIKESSKWELVLRACEEKSLWSREEKEIEVETQDTTTAFLPTELFGQSGIFPHPAQRCCVIYAEALWHGGSLFSLSLQ